ncbi:MAG: hypothetical protein R3F55_05230 [Alphaproteobacteria bacterium]
MNASPAADAGPPTGALAGLIASSFALSHDADDDARREILDILAVAAALKPVAAIGFDTDAERLDRYTGAAERCGLVVAPCRPWVSLGEFDRVPRWFVEAVLAARTRKRLVAISACPELLARLANCRTATLDAAEEAGLLGYPPCCVADHAVRRAAMQRDLAAATLAAGQGDPQRAGRLAAAGWLPHGFSGGALAEARCGRLSGLLMCRECAADPLSPAMRLEASYAMLADRIGFDAVRPAATPFDGPRP